MVNFTPINNGCRQFMELVELKFNDRVCDSSELARQLKIKHIEVVRRIEVMLNDFPDIREASNHPKPIEKYWIEDRHYRGTDYTAYLMNREFFSLLMGRFTTPRARKAQREFNAAFYELEKRLLEKIKNGEDTQWLEERKQSRLARREETDVIKDFVDYATDQGSKSARMYYKHYTNATYKALGLIQHGKPAIRETLDLMQLNQLVMAEVLAKNAIKKYMEEEEHYKTIYTLVKQDLEGFAASTLLN